MDLGEVPEVTRCEPLKLNEWKSFLDDAGRVTSVKKLHDRVFRGVGNQPDLKYIYLEWKWLGHGLLWCDLCYYYMYYC